MTAILGDPFATCPRPLGDNAATLIVIPASQAQAAELLRALTLEQLIEQAETGSPENKLRFAAGARRFAAFLEAVPLTGYGHRRMAAQLLREFATRAELNAARQHQAMLAAAGFSPSPHGGESGGAGATAAAE